MKVRSIAPHANPFGRGRGKPVGTEYDLPAADAKAEIEAGHVKRIDAPKVNPAEKKPQKAEAPKA